GIWPLRPVLFGSSGCTGEPYWERSRGLPDTEVRVPHEHQRIPGPVLPGRRRPGKLVPGLVLALASGLAGIGGPREHVDAPVARVRGRLRTEAASHGVAQHLVPGPDDVLRPERSPAATAGVDHEVPAADHGGDPPAVPDLSRGP